MKRPIAVLTAVAITMAAGVGITAAALDAGPQSLEARTQAVASTLRCPTCDNLSVADSPSPMARSMRGRIAEQLTQGRPPDEIRQWFVDRYGPWILLNPPREGVSILVWMAPLAALAVGGGVAVWLLRGRRRGTPAAADVDTGALADSWREGELDMPDTPAGERLEAALRWLDEEHHAAAGGGQRRAAAAAEEAAAAWQALERAADEQPAGRRPIGWAGGGLLLLAAIAAALPATIGARDVGGIATGGVPAGSGADVLAEQDGPPAGSRDEAGDSPTAAAGNDARRVLAELDELAAAEDDPADAAAAVASQLPDDASVSDRLTVGLLALQHDQLAAADALAASVLAEDSDNDEAILLRGLTLTARGEDNGAAWLQRFVDSAPAGHPGRAVAEDALAGDQTQR